MPYGNMGYTNKYREAGTYGQSQSEIEAGALVRTAAKMNEAKKNYDNDKNAFYEALTRNRKLWAILVSNINEPNNGMSHDLRQNLANLAYFIFKQTIKLMAGNDIKGVDVLIEINMNVAKGLTSDRLKNKQEGNTEDQPVSAGPATESFNGDF